MSEWKKSHADVRVSLLCVEGRIEDGTFIGILYSVSTVLVYIVIKYIFTVKSDFKTRKGAFKCYIYRRMHRNETNMIK